MKKRKKYIPKLSPNLPEQFVDKLQKILSEKDFTEVMTAFSIKRPTSLRVNTLKSNVNDIEVELQQKQINYQKTCISDLALILTELSSREATELDCYKNAGIYLQNLSSMLPPLILKPQPGEKVLDMTAAPGSKTSQMAAMMQEQGELIAFELNFPRFKRLEANLKMQTSGNFVQIRHEPGENAGFKFPEYFDKILLDAPCSSEGQFSLLAPKSYAYWNRHKSKEMVSKQTKLLNAAFMALKPGGTLLYSTCTFAPEENEQIVNKFLGKHEDQIKLMPINITTDLDNARAGLTKYNDKEYKPELSQTVRILPNQFFEGFYLALFQKENK